MEPMRRWAARISTIIMTATLAVAVPAIAWASSNGVYDIASEVARRKSRVGLGGVFGVLCCLVVVAVIVVVVLVVLRKKNKR